MVLAANSAIEYASGGLVTSAGQRSAIGEGDARRSWTVQVITSEEGVQPVARCGAGLLFWSTRTGKSSDGRTTVMPPLEVRRCGSLLTA